MTDIQLPKLACLSDELLATSLAAVDDIRECYRVLEKGGLNIVGEVLKGQGAFFEMDHYPKEDVYDRDSASQYYYHAHREDHAEHGHFHLFLRNAALPADAEPLMGPRGADRVAHLVMISMDSWGFPTDLSAVNRWVTDESWLAAEKIVMNLDRFAIDHAYPSWPVNRWLTAMVQCFRPQIETLLYRRDEILTQQQGQSLEQVLEDRSLEIIATIQVNVESWSDSLQTEKARRAAATRS